MVAVPEISALVGAVRTEPKTVTSSSLKVPEAAAAEVAKSARCVPYGYNLKVTAPPLVVTKLFKFQVITLPTTGESGAAPQEV